MKSSNDLDRGRGHNASPSKVTILGVGNELLSDEGVGVHVARRLMEVELPSHIEVIEGGTDGFGLINIITDTDRLIVVDSVKGGNAPGTLYRFDIDDVPSAPGMFKTSVHQISILEVIDLSSLVGKRPHTTIIGVEPARLTISLELSEVVKTKIPRIIELIFETIDCHLPEEFKCMS